MLLQGKTIIITGASSGIGEATALACAAEGANLVLGARRKHLLDSLAERIVASGGAATVVAGDVRDENYAATLVRLAISEFGSLDAAFNNAGVLGEMGPITEMRADAWRDVIETNLTSAFFAVKHQIPAMVKGGGGSIVLTSSFVGPMTAGLPGMGAYAASKAGLVGLARAIACDHGADAIRVNALLPGGTHTAMAGEDPAGHDFVAGLHALKRLASPEEIAQSAVFLLSDRASFVTGGAMTADGGISVMLD